MPRYLIASFSLTKIALAEAAFTDLSLFTRISDSHGVGLLVLIILLSMSVLSWAVFACKWLSLRQQENRSKHFSQEFWDCRSLNELNQSLSKFPQSPLRELFRNAYGELLRANQVQEQIRNTDMGVKSALQGLGRTLQKAKQEERRTLERYLPLLAITASSAPFIGLFGTVWGIMNSLEQIGISGQSSLASVAPGIAEALIATAFGLAAAIPAVIGYNIALYKIRRLAILMDGFSLDFLNIVERYLVNDRFKKVDSGKVS